MCWITHTLGDRQIEAPAAVTLVPTLTTNYQRRTLQVAGQDGEPPSRMTLDVGLSRERRLPRHPVVHWSSGSTSSLAETKGGPQAPRRPDAPVDVGTACWASASTGLVSPALRPDLPTLKWHHLLDVCLAA